MENEPCAPSYILGLLSRKWTYLILRHLREPARFGDLGRFLPTITHHMLAEELKRLEKEELIQHRDNRYSLTEAGRELLEAVECLIMWTHKHKGHSLCSPQQNCADCVRFQAHAEHLHWSSGR